MDNRDNVRIDLLKFRRKAYNSYPEGSMQRKEFLKTILQNELRLTKDDVPHDIINLVIEGQQIVLADTLKKIFGWLALASLNLVLFTYFWPSIRYFSSIFIGVGAACLSLAIDKLVEYYRYYKSVDVIKKYSNDINKHMTKISNDIKRLEGPHGF